MIKRDELTQFINHILGGDVLKQAAIADTMPNGVQIRGAESVSQVALGVSCSQAFLDQAITQKSQYVIVHHGLAPDRYIANGRFDFLEDRLKLIFKHDLTLAGFHYALDAHPVLGNNAQIIQKLGATRLEEPYFESWGWVGEFKKPVEVQTLKKQATALFKHEIYSIEAGPAKIKRVGVVSGGARPRGGELFEIIDHQIDLHLTGEIAEGDLHQAIAGKYTYFACGHYATETFGVKALGEAIKVHFGNRLKVEFIDIPTVLWDWLLLLY